MVVSTKTKGSVISDEVALAAFANRLAKAAVPLVPDAGAIKKLLSSVRHKTISKGEHLLRAGDVAKEVFFVHRGLLRYYFTDFGDGGTERTGQFFDDGIVVTDAESFLTKTPAKQSIEALEISSVVIIPRAALYAGYDDDHAIERFGRLMLEEALIGSQRRAGRLLTLQPEERYRTFVQSRPEVARRVPQYLIASYLGLTPESLSRVRRRISSK